MKIVQEMSILLMILCFLIALGWFLFYFLYLEKPNELNNPPLQDERTDPNVLQQEYNYWCEEHPKECKG